METERRGSRMTDRLTPGTWVQLPNGRVVRIVERDETRGVLLAATPRGDPVEAALAVADARWKPLDDEGLLVRRVVDVAGLRHLAEQDPAGLVAAALLDLGPATASQLRGALSPEPIPESEFDAWWKRNQPRLREDQRIGLRARTYELGRSSLTRTTQDRQLIRRVPGSDRAALDGAILARARSLILAGDPLDHEDRALVLAVAKTYEQQDLDPTDRVLAFDVAERLALTEWESGAEPLGSIILDVDLLRVRDRDTRTRILHWAVDYCARKRPRSDWVDAPLLESAGAIGGSFEADALGLASQAGAPAELVFRGRLGWGVPGADPADPPKYPADLDAYERRVARVATGPFPAAGEAIGLALGAARGLHWLRYSRAHEENYLRVMRRLAAVAWDAEISLADLIRRAIDGPVSQRGVDALIEVASREDRPSRKARVGELRSLLSEWFAAEPDVYLGALQRFSRQAGVDAVAWVTDIALAAIRRTNAPMLATMAFDLARERAWTDDAAAESARLAGTVASDHHGVAEGLSARGAEAAKDLLQGRTATVDVWLDASGWNAIVASIAETVGGLRSAVRDRDQQLSLLGSELERVNALLVTREAALWSSREAQGAAGREVATRQAAGLLRPVAAAIADSYESASLAALQQALDAVLRRNRITPIAEVGEIVEFDPSRHRWVGTGVATERGLVISPGYELRSEGSDDVVLVPARIVDPPAS
jgi:hypothetical protein